MGMLVSGKSNMAAGYKMAGKLAQLYVPNVDVSWSFRVYITIAYHDEINEVADFSL